MRGEPTDVDGECNARMYVADDYGDNSATIRCQLAAGHDGLHQEQYPRKGGTVTITWTVDERRRCDHGCGQWEHAHHAAVSCPKDSDDHDYHACALCHPGEAPTTCVKCGQQHFLSERMHQYRCSKTSRDEQERLKAQDASRDFSRDADSDVPSGGL